jgi:hypothetical protein
MAEVYLTQMFKLIGKLEDSDDPQSASGRFRDYLKENVDRAANVRSFVDDALNLRDDQANRALQDLVNHIGRLLGFDVEFGRYRGVQGQIGFDGLWRSPETNQCLVVEVKKSETYTIGTPTLLGYINELVSAGRVELDQTHGIYAVGRIDKNIRQLEKTIQAEGRERQLRVATIEALLHLLDLQQDYNLKHSEVTKFLLPPGPSVDPPIELLFQVIAQERHRGAEEEMARPEAAGEPNYYLLPAADEEDRSAIQVLRELLGKGIWGLGRRSRFREAFRSGDRICFYAARVGVVAECTAVSPAVFRPEHDEAFPYVLELKDVRWLDRPVALTSEVRRQLSAFKDKELSKSWAWFVFGTARLTREDFELLTGRAKPERPAA